MFGKNFMSKSSKNKIFREYCVFEYAQMAKNENPKMLEINRKLPKSEKHLVSIYLFYLFIFSLFIVDKFYFTVQSD